MLVAFVVIIVGEFMFAWPVRNVSQSVTVQRSLLTHLSYIRMWLMRSSQNKMLKPRPKMTKNKLQMHVSPKHYYTHVAYITYLSM